MWPSFFSSPYRAPWDKTIKYFATLSIYKISISISLCTRNTLILRQGINFSSTPRKLKSNLINFSFSSRKPFYVIIETWGTFRHFTSSVCVYVCVCVCVREREREEMSVLDWVMLRASKHLELRIWDKLFCFLKTRGR